MPPALPLRSARPAKPGLRTARVPGAARPVASARQGRPAQGLPACVAGFYDEESDQREAARLLRVSHGLTSSQLVLLGPGDAAPLLFARVARRWATQRAGRGQGGLAVPAVLVALAGSVLALLAIGWWVVLRLDLSAGAVVLGSVLSLLCIGVTAAAVATQWSEPSHDDGFDVTVRGELTQGRWALVLHRIPADRQVGVVRLLRNGSQRWCAAAVPAP